MIRLRTPHHEWIAAAGIALLAGMFAAGVTGSEEGAPQPVESRLQALPDGDGRMSPLSDGGDALIVDGGNEREVGARLHLRLPPPRPGDSPWVVWLGREPVDAVGLRSGDWRSPERDFFRPGADETLLPAGYLFHLPAHWQGPVSLDVHARGNVRGVLRPQVLREHQAMRIEQRAVAITAMAYASLFTLGMLALALFVAARDRTFLTFFGFAMLALLVLAAGNGHLYALPAFGLLGVFRGNGLWALMLAFSAAALQMVMRFALSERAWPEACRTLDRACLGLLVLAALCLLPLRALDAWMQGLTTLAWITAMLVCLALLVDAVRRRVTMAWPVLASALLTMVGAIAMEAASRGAFADGGWTHYGYQIALVFSVAMLGVGLISRISEYREQRDRDQLARVDSERRLHREAARSELTTALQMRLRALAAGDIQWTAFRLLVEHLAKAVPSAAATVVAQGYHAHDVLVIEPPARREAVQAGIARRSLLLKRLAANGIPVQQPVTVAESSGVVATEALVPLGIRAPAWGAVLLERAGDESFGAEELALVADFARIAVSQIDQAMTALSLRRTAEIDALTGSFNRRSIDQWLGRSFSEAHRDRLPLSVLFVDLDHFKAINDRLGHACGDHCLRKLAMTLRGALGDGDLFGRYGGEEFIAILPGRGGAAARVIGEQLRAAVEATEIEWSGQVLRLTVSVGVATRLEGEDTPAAAVERADKALYAAKRNGRNCVHVAPAVFT